MMKEDNITKSRLEAFFKDALSECDGCLGPWKAIALFTFINATQKEELPIWDSLEQLEHTYRNEHEKALATILFFLVSIKRNNADWSAYLSVYDETHAIDLLGTEFHTYLNYWVATMMLLSIESITDEQKMSIIKTPSDPLLRNMLKSMVCP